MSEGNTITTLSNNFSPLTVFFTKPHVHTLRSRMDSSSVNIETCSKPHVLLCVTHHFLLNIGSTPCLQLLISSTFYRHPQLNLNHLTNCYTTVNRTTHSSAFMDAHAIHCSLPTLETSFNLTANRAFYSATPPLQKDTSVLISPLDAFFSLITLCLTNLLFHFTSSSQLAQPTSTTSDNPIPPLLLTPLQPSNTEPPSAAPIPSSTIVQPTATLSTNYTPPSSSTQLNTRPTTLTILTQC